MALKITYFRPIKSTAELDLQARIDELLASNPMVTDPLAFSFNIRPLCGNRWQIEHRSGSLYLYRSCESLLTRKPVACLSVA
jgi:hypothetical protein